MNAKHAPEWPKIVTIDGVPRCYFGPFDLVGMSCAEFEKVNLSSDPGSPLTLLRQRDELRDALERLLAAACHCDPHFKERWKFDSEQARAALANCEKEFVSTLPTFADKATPGPILL